VKWNILQIVTLADETLPWEIGRKTWKSIVEWRFTTADARIKLKK
jgi:hypothetical protein